MRNQVHDLTVSSRKLLMVLSGLALLLTSCGLAGRAVVAEGAVGRAVIRHATRSELALLQRSGLRLAANEIVVADAAAFRSAMAGVRVRSTMFGRPQLYLPHESTAFAEVLSGNTIRMLRSNQRLELPGTLHVVRGSRAQFRVGPGKNYHVMRMLDQHQLVLVEAVESGWCRALVGDEVGWIAAASLAALMAEAWDEQR